MTVSLQSRAGDDLSHAYIRQGEESKILNLF